MTLASFIASHRDPILETWERRASARLPRLANAGQLRDHLGELLDAIAREVVSKDRTGDTDHADHTDHTGDADNASASEAAGNVAVVAEKHGAGRARAGITLEDMVREFPVLRSSVLRQWIQSVQAPTVDDLEEVIRFDAALDRALAESVSEFMDQLNHSRERFLSILGHDLRNPLSTVIAGSQLLRDEHLDADRSRVVLNRIVATGERMHQLVIDLVDFTRARVSGLMPIERRKCDLATTVHDAAGEFATAHPDRVVNVDVSGDLSGMWDDKRMGQAVGNLLGNAVQHGASDMPIDLSARAEERQVSIAVHNDGPAIPEENRQVLFDPMRATEKRRTHGGDSNHLGLGLYIARAIAVGHGGAIDVESSAERGTTFTIRLPRQPSSECS